MSITDSKAFINSRLNCPVCTLLFAKNYIGVHLKKQHSNIYNTADWDGSRYAENYERIKREHRIKWGIN